VRSLRPHIFRNPFEKSRSKQSEFFVREVKDKRMTKNGPEFLIGWFDFPLERDDTCESNLTGSENMICEFQNKHELDYSTKIAAVLKQVADGRKTMNEKNTTALDNTTDDIQEARDHNGCDDDEEEDDNEDEEHGMGHTVSGVQRKRRQELNAYVRVQ
jgi:hypothetical protein